MVDLRYAPEAVAHCLRYIYTGSMSYPSSRCQNELDAESIRAEIAWPFYVNLGRRLGHFISVP